MSAVSQKWKGFFCGAMAAVAYGMNPLFSLPLYDEGLSPAAVLFYRYTLAVVLIAILMKLGGKSFRLPLNMLFPVMIGSALMGISSLTLFQSYLEMDAGIASTILFVYPVMVAVIMAIFWGERITWSVVLGIIGSLAGVLILYQGDGSNVNLKGLMLVLGSALSFAVYIIAVRETSLSKVPAEVLTLYVMLFCIPVFFWRTGWGKELYCIQEWIGWGCIVALAFIPTVVAFFLLALSSRLIGATKTAILGALEPATAVFFGVLVFGEALTQRLIIGLVVIVLSVILVVLGKEQTAKKGSGKSKKAGSAPAS